MGVALVYSPTHSLLPRQRRFPSDGSENEKHRLDRCFSLLTIMCCSDTIIRETPEKESRRKEPSFALFLAVIMTALEVYYVLQKMRGKDRG